MNSKCLLFGHEYRIRSGTSRLSCRRCGTEIDPSEPEEDAPCPVCGHDSLGYYGVGEWGCPVCGYGSGQYEDVW